MKRPNDMAYDGYSDHFILVIPAAGITSLAV